MIKETLCGFLMALADSVPGDGAIRIPRRIPAPGVLIVAAFALAKYLVTKRRKSV